MKKYASFLKRKIHRLHEQMRSYFRHSQTATISQANESGRSMVEILAVLAIMGVLAVVGIVVYKYAMDKHRANTILQDAHLGFASIRGTRAEQFDWTPVNFEPKSGKPVDVLRDSDRDDYVRVQEIELSVCKQILLMAVPGKLMFYDEQGEDMLTCPDELNTIIFAFEGTRAPGVNCETGTDCESEGEGAYCNTDKGVCRTCPVEEGFVVSPNGEACWPVCDEDTETTCMTDTEHWCCDNTLLCGDEVGTCKPSSGVCEYRLKSQTSEKEADCIYRYENQTKKAEGDCSCSFSAQTSVKQADCSCDFSAQTSVKQADCIYSTSGTGENFKLIEEKGCPSDQYCYLAYSDEGCESSLGGAGASKMYGTCTSLAMTNPTCPIKSLGDPLSSCTSCPSGQYCYVAYSDEGCESSLGGAGASKMYGSCTSLAMTSPTCPIKSLGEPLSSCTPCPTDQYCYLAYSDNSCENPLGGAGAPTMYGRCTSLAMTSPTCNILEISGVLTPIKECDGKDQYCYLSYKDEGCESSLGGAGAEIMYGTCTSLAMTSPTCPIKSLDTNILTPVEECPSSQYCYLKYSAPNCQNAVGGTGANPFYGVCLPLDENNAVCPVEED